MRKTGFLLWLLICAAAGTLFSQALVINYRVDTQADSSRLVVSVVYDSLDLGEFILVHRWPDSSVAKLYGFNSSVLEFTPIRPFSRQGEVWRSGGGVILGDSLCPPMLFKLEGDTLLPR